MFRSTSVQELVLILIRSVPLTRSGSFSLSTISSYSNFCLQKWEIMWREFAVPKLAADVDTVELPMTAIEEVLAANKTVCDSCFDANVAAVRQSVADFQASVAHATRQWREARNLEDIAAIKDAIEVLSCDHPMQFHGYVIEGDLNLLARCALMGLP